jgi:hypothetical protein
VQLFWKVMQSVTTGDWNWTKATRILPFYVFCVLQFKLFINQY